MKRYIPVIFAALLLAGCVSTRAAVPPPGESAGEYRELQGELYRQQADIAVAGQKIEDQGRGLVEDLTRLEEAMSTAPDAGETERLYWLSQVQAARAGAGVHQADIENLNRKLAEERETVRKQNQKFTDYETEMTRNLSDRDTEISLLREENKAVKGQRNTFLAILITAGVVIVLFAGIKFLRVIKIIPF
jgi:PBP1b-binding outer membrane lipoprotein LpoB